METEQSRYGRDDYTVTTNDDNLESSQEEEASFV